MIVFALSNHLQMQLHLHLLLFQSLLEHQDAVAPDHTDPLHELLDDLGEVPDAEALIGGSLPFA